MRVPGPTRRRVPRQATVERTRPTAHIAPKTRSFTGTSASWPGRKPPGRNARPAAPSSAAFTAQVPARRSAAVAEGAAAKPRVASSTGLRSTIAR